MKPLGQTSMAFVEVHINIFFKAPSSSRKCFLSSTFVFVFRLKSRVQLTCGNSFRIFQNLSERFTRQVNLQINSDKLFPY